MSLSDLPAGIAAWLTVLSAFLGAAVASFAGCAASRLPRGGDFLRGRSRCDSCGRALPAWELVPVISYLALRGRCRGCGARIPPACPISEAVAGAAFAALLWRFGFGFWTLGAMIFAGILAALALFDWETGELPDGLILAGILNFILFGFLEGGFPRLLEGLLGGLAASVPLLLLALLMDRLLRRESMGGGDIKLFFAAGLYLSWREVLFFILAACAMGLVIALITRKTTGDPENPGATPFGPAIAMAAALSILFAAPATDWYLGLF